MGVAGSAGVNVHVIKAAPVNKADRPTHLAEQDKHTVSKWIEPPYNMRGLKNYVTNSSILPQCIRAYKSNIAGFGIGIRYKEDYPEETEEMKREYTLAEDVIELLTMDMDTKELFEDVVEGRETYGISYGEAIRATAGQVVGLEYIRDTPSVRKTKPLEPYIDAKYFYKGQIVTRPRKFCKYKQQIGTETVYFKEFGDPRIMDKRTGDYVAELDLQYQANEILEFAIGTEPYGEVRWIGQILGVDGSHKAEGLNNNYFENGRHTPLLILLKNGTLKDGSFQKLQEYMGDIKGEKGQHAFLIMEVENADTRTDWETQNPPDIEVKDLASVLQKDELFQDYLDNSRRKVQSSFLLPDLYVGYTTDFNRATAQTAKEVTEEQVFQPERASLTWILNNKLLIDYEFKYVEAYFKSPNISNPDDMAKLLNITERAGGLPPNKAKEITYKVLGEVAEDYEGDWANIPLQYVKAVATPSELPPLEEMGNQLSAQIQKAQAGNDDAVVAVMKEVRALLLRIQKEAAKECVTAPA